MIQTQQAPLYYFHQLINLGGFEAELVKFYDHFDFEGEHSPADLSIDKEAHVASCTVDYEGV